MGTRFGARLTARRHGEQLVLDSCSCFVADTNTARKCTHRWGDHINKFNCAYISVPSALQVLQNRSVLALETPFCDRAPSTSAGRRDAKPANSPFSPLSTRLSTLYTLKQARLDPASAKLSLVIATRSRALPLDLRRSCSSPKNKIVTYPDVSDDVSYVISTKYDGRRVCVASAKLVVDLELTAAHAGPHEDGAGTTADATGGPKVGEHAHEEIMIKDNS